MRFVASVATSLTLLFALPAGAATARAAAKAPAADPAPASSGGAALDMRDLKVSGWIGGEFGDLSGVYLRADATLPVLALAPNLKLLGFGSLGYVHLGDSSAFADVSWNMVKVLAGGRVQMDLAPKLDGFADLGIGFYFGGWNSETSTVIGIDPITLQPIYGKAKFDGTDGGFTMRLAVGGHYQLDPRFSLGAELGLNPYFGEGETTNFFIGVGAEMKLQ